MSKKKKSSKPEVTVAEVQRRLSAVEARLAKSEKKLAKATARAERWKTEAKTRRAEARAQRGEVTAQRRAATKHREEAARAADRATTLQRKLDRARTSRSEPASSAPPSSTRTETLAPEVPEVPEAPEVPDVPDESWTVVRLRAEARDRNLTGMSGKSKAELIEALS